MNFQSWLIKSIEEKNSVLVVGLDPNLDLFQDFILDNAKDDKSKSEAILRFNKIVIDTVCEHCIAVKPQLAYYEVFWSYGIKALEETISYAKKKNLLVILDAKRGDIGSTCEAYAEAFLGQSRIAADAVTVNPYLGRDGILPFIHQADENERGLFILVKTSNPSSNDLQNLITKDEEEIYIKVAKLTNEFIKEELGYSNIGAIVRGTYPDEAKKIRNILKKSFFLVPGYGAQWASGKDLKEYFDNNGLGALISASRSLTYPYLYTDVNKWNIFETNLKDMILLAVKKLMKILINLDFKIIINYEIMNF